MCLFLGGSGGGGGSFPFFLGFLFKVSGIGMELPQRLLLDFLTVGNISFIIVSSVGWFLFLSFSSSTKQYLALAGRPPVNFYIRLAGGFTGQKHLSVAAGLIQVYS